MTQKYFDVSRATDSSGHLGSQLWTRLLKHSMMAPSIADDSSNLTWTNFGYGSYSGLGFCLECVFWGYCWECVFWDFHLIVLNELVLVIWTLMEILRQDVLLTQNETEKTQTLNEILSALKT